MFAKFFLAAALQILVTSCDGLRLTNMTAPALQDPRRDMELHCRFDMGGEDLYAVKWYKDDHEFFRYSPASNPSITQFRVAGVEVVSGKTRCMRVGCDLLLTNLSRTDSSGAYRCEVSSEAPAFRLASQTHNVTVAALPEHLPKITGLRESYRHNDLISANCSSGLGDPKPILTWYFNEQQVQGRYVREIPPNPPAEPQNDRIHLESTTNQLKLPVEKKHTHNRDKITIHIACASSTEGISPAVAPPLITTQTVTLIDPDLLVNNLKYHSLYSSGISPEPKAVIVLTLTLLMRWC